MVRSESEWWWFNVNRGVWVSVYMRITYSSSWTTTIRSTHSTKR
jgi:hypothetical protein